MLFRRQNLYAPRSKSCTRRREAQSRELINKVKKELSVISQPPGLLHLLKFGFWANRYLN
jgi:hypothetical protein